jgi:hypothetical protein
MTLRQAGLRAFLFGFTILLTVMTAVPASAQSPGANPAPTVATDQDTDLARQQQNPISSLISVPLQANWDFGLGDRDATGTLFNIQPVVPFPVSRSTNLILRVIMPLASQPGSGDVRVNGLGDVVATAFFSPAKSGRVSWGEGPVFLLPTATNNALGSRPVNFVVGAGPTVASPEGGSTWRSRFMAVFLYPR